MLNMQAANVEKPFMSVGSVCEAGREMVFCSYGEHIRHCSGGQETKFARITMYRLKVDVVLPPVFSWAGMQ